MSSAQEIVTDAYRALGALDINADEPSPAMITRGLRVLTQMIDAWAGDGLTVRSQALTGTIALGRYTITALADPSLSDSNATLGLAPGFAVNATGIPASARIRSVDSATQVTLDAAATADTAGLSIGFNLLPLQERYEQGVIALLALQLAPLVQIDDIPPMVALNASRGWDLLVGNFYVVPDASYDPGLLSTSVRRTSAFNA